MSEDPPGGDFLCLRGALKRAQGQASQAQDKEANKIDRENQLVVHDPGLEKVEEALKGRAEKARSIPENTLRYQPEGKYVIKQADDFSFLVGTKVQLEFEGVYHSKPVKFTNIMVEVVSAPITKKGHQYVEVKFPYNQRLLIEDLNKYTYLSIDMKSFYIQIK